MLVNITTRPKSNIYKPFIFNISGFCVDTLAQSVHFGVHAYMMRTVEVLSP